MDNYRRRNRNDFDDERRQSRRSRRFKLIFLLVLIFAMGGYVVFWLVTNENANTYEEMGFWDFHSHLDRNEIGFIIDGQRVEIEARPVFIGNELYLPIDLVREFVDEHVYWDGNERISITTRTKAFRIDLGRLEHTVNGRQATLALPVILHNGKPFIPADFIASLNGVDFVFKDYINAIVMVNNANVPAMVRVTEDGIPLKFEPTISRGLSFFRRGTTIYVQKLLSTTDELIHLSNEGSFIRVQTENGLVGYVDSGFFEVISQAQIAPVVMPEPVFDGMVNMVWDLMTNITAVRNEARRYVPHGLNVISPTFFEFSTALDGTLISIADQGYVDWAKSNGWQVWALIADKLEGHFRADVARHVFTNTAHRERAIDQLVAFVDQYMFDGICINFEAIRAEYADHYILFLRELAPLLRERGVILSVTMFVPWNHNLHYNREQAALAADFIIIMGYDEHYATSAVAGPNASINFVQNGINRTLWEVPHNQIILGIPLYVRVWRETQTGDGIVVSQNAMGMNEAYNLFIDNGAQFVWCEITLSYYSEFRGVDSEGRTYTRRVWLEEERSISAKLDLVIYHDLAGTAGWRKGLERPEIWNVLMEYFELIQ